MFFLLLIVLFLYLYVYKCSSHEISSLIHIVSSLLDSTKFLFNPSFLLFYKMWTCKRQKTTPFSLVSQHVAQKCQKLGKSYKVLVTWKASCKRTFCLQQGFHLTFSFLELSEPEFTNTPTLPRRWNLFL